jgi:hypothetical protein
MNASVQAVIQSDGSSTHKKQRGGVVCGVGARDNAKPTQLKNNSKPNPSQH